MASERVIQKSVEKALNRLAGGGWWSRPDMFRCPQLDEVANAPRWQRHLLVHLQGRGWISRQGERGAVRYQAAPGAAQSLRALAVDLDALAAILFPRYAPVPIGELHDEEEGAPEQEQLDEPGGSAPAASADDRIDALLRVQLGIIERLNHLIDVAERIDRNTGLLVTDLRGEPASGRS